MQRKIWVPSKEECWVLADIVVQSSAATAAGSESGGAEGGGIVVDVPGEGRQTLPSSSTHRCDATHFEDHEDLCEMNHLHEAPLLHCLRTRFAQDKIYTTTGDVLISVNPYKRIAGLYDSVMAYLDLPEDGDIDRDSAPPHVYKVANAALQEMLYGKRSSLTAAVSPNQSIVVSGESGAGKTEASKQVRSLPLPLALPLPHCSRVLYCIVCCADE